VAGGLRVAVMVGAGLAVVLPLLYVLRIAVAEVPGGFFEQQTTLPRSLGPEAGFTLENFRNVWTLGGMREAFGTSLATVPLGAAIATTVASLAGFAFAKLAVPAGNLWFGLLAVTLGVPIPAIAIPLLTQGLSLGYADSRVGLAIAYGALFSVFGTIFMRYYYKDFPDSLLEAARIDGAGTIRIFLRIVLPLSAPAIATLFVITMLVLWGELLLALVLLPRGGDNTVSVAVARFTSEYGTGGPALAAAAVLAAVPIMLVISVAQRWLRTGLSAGSVKE
jgi:ABC-type glycerol-3-phosphate transport system permease component